MRKKFFVSAALAVFISGAVFAQTLSLDTMPNPSPVTYDPYSSSDSTGPQSTFTVRISKKPGSNVNFYVLIDGATSPSNRTLVFSENSAISLTAGFFKDNTYQTQILSTANATSSTLISGQFAKGTTVLTQTFTVYPSLQKGQSAPAGTYAGNFSLKLYNGTFPRGTLADTNPFTYTANVNPVIDVRVGSALDTYATGVSTYNINLGEVSHGASAQFGIFIRANTAYTLTMSATSGGYLTSGTTTDKIQYTLTIDSTSYTLGSGILINQETAKGMYSKAFIGQVSVPADQSVEAGQYSDTISFSITSN